MNTVASLVARRMDPTTLVRYAATSTSTMRQTSPERRRINILKRLVRRRKAVSTHMGGSHPRLSATLHANRMNAIRRAQRPNIAQASKLRRLRLQAGRAHWQYQLAGTNNTWNKFVRIHIKSGGQPNINRRTAARIYG